MNTIDSGDNISECIAVLLIRSNQLNFVFRNLVFGEKARLMLEFSNAMLIACALWLQLWMVELVLVVLVLAILVNV